MIDDSGSGEQNSGADPSGEAKGHQGDRRPDIGPTPPTYDKHGDSSAYRAHRQRKEADPDRKLQWATLGLTAVTAGAAFGAVVFAGLQWHEAHEGGKIAEAQTRAAQTIADSAKRQTAISAGLLQVGRLQAEAQASLAKSAEVTSGLQGRAIQVEGGIAAATKNLSKPYLQIGTLTYEGFDDDTPGLAFHDVELSYSFLNVGTGPLIEKSTAFSTFFGTALPRKMPQLEDSGAHDIILPPGLQARVGSVVPIGIKVSDVDFQAVRRGLERPIFFGSIIYTDAQRELHRYCFAYSASPIHEEGSLVKSEAYPYPCTRPPSDRRQSLFSPPPA